eukprot:767335-Hanusia_phi.AAC.7
MFAAKRGDMQCELCGTRSVQEMSAEHFQRWRRKNNLTVRWLTDTSVASDLRAVGLGNSCRATGTLRSFLLRRARSTRCVMGSMPRGSSKVASSAKHGNEDTSEPACSFDAWQMMQKLAAVSLGCRRQTARLLQGTTGRLRRFCCLQFDLEELMKVKPRSGASCT